MPLSPGGAQLIGQGIELVGGALLSRGTRSAEKKLLGRQAQLADLQIEEQRLRNKALAATLGEQDARLPFELTNPGGPGAARTSILGVDVAEASTKEQAAPKSSMAAAGWIVGLAVAGAFLFARKAA